MHEPDAPQAQRGHDPPRRTWIQPTAQRTAMTSQLMQWVDDNGSIVRLIATDTPATELAPHDD